MLGWMLIFSVMVLGGCMSVVNEGIGLGAGLTATAVFGFLLLISVFTRLLRSRA
jgi:hypothetical protein